MLIQKVPLSGKASLDHLPSPRRYESTRAAMSSACRLEHADFVLHCPTVQGSSQRLLTARTATRYKESDGVGRNFG
jgi:hypothetical protein